MVVLGHSPEIVDGRHCNSLAPRLGARSGCAARPRAHRTAAGTRVQCNCKPCRRSCHCVAARDQSAVPADAITETRGAFRAALRRGDAATACAVYAEEATLLPPSAELVRGRDAIEAFWRAGLETGVADAAYEPLTLELVGELAYEIGRYTLRLCVEEGGTVVDHGKYVLLYARLVDGSWRRTVEMFSPETPPRLTEEAEGPPSSPGRPRPQ